MLPRDRNFYLTNVILPQLSCRNCTSVVSELTNMVSSDVIVKVTSSCHVASKNIQELLGAFFKHKILYLMMSKSPLFM